MRKLLCLQCKIAGLYVKNERKERLLVYVSDEEMCIRDRYIFVLEFTIHSCYGNFERDDFGTVSYTHLFRRIHLYQ